MRKNPPTTTSPRQWRDRPHTSVEGTDCLVCRLHGDDSPSQALIADVFTAVLPDGSTRVLHLAVGDVDELWVVAPRAGRPVLMRGGAFSFYEFEGKPGERLGDGEWNVKLFEAPPPRPAWARPVEVKLP